MFTLSFITFLKLCVNSFSCHTHLVRTPISVVNWTRLPH